jgi:hypothetical protein
LGARGLRTRFSAVSPDTGVLSDKRNSSQLRASAVRGRDQEWVVGKKLKVRRRRRVVYGKLAPERRGGKSS